MEDNGVNVVWQKAAMRRLGGLSDSLSVSRGIIRKVLRKRAYRAAAITAAMAYSAIYAYLTGIVAYYPDFDISTIMPVPYLAVILRGPIGVVPVLLSYPTNHIVVFVTLGSGLAMLLLSTLTGVNVALLSYSLKEARCAYRREGSIGSIGQIPGFFAAHICCGGGPLLAALGTGVFVPFLPYSNLLIASGAALLLLSAVLLSRGIARQATCMESYQISSSGSKVFIKP